MGRTAPGDAGGRALQVQPGVTLKIATMMYRTPSLRSRSIEKHLHWQALLVPEIRRRLAADDDDPAPEAIVATAIACLDVAGERWVSGGGVDDLSALYDRAVAGVRSGSLRQGASSLTRALVLVVGGVVQSRTETLGGRSPADRHSLGICSDLPLPPRSLEAYAPVMERLVISTPNAPSSPLFSQGVRAARRSRSPAWSESIRRPEYRPVPPSRSRPSSRSGTARPS